MTPLAYLKLGIAGAIIASAFLFGRSCGRSGLERFRAEYAASVASENDRHREEERAMSVEFNRVDTEYQGKLKAINETTEKYIAAGIRAGTLKLRDAWRCEVPGPVAGASQSYAVADDRAESAGRIVRAAAECDSQVIGLQGILQAERTGVK